MEQPETVPTWVLQEVGRLHLHALALERELANRPQPEPDPADQLEQPHDHEASGFYRPTPNTGV